ncbi:MAG: T9SS type A sorting domain-containing protein [Candidatus Electryonea clarkiae]|nr:T9SS type A sorting domain-containing protein [Candidatus Electryonea clarkiae]MDP8288462.1 T9SS type A sorting domain-containing protein [Candidatus Electryonea clarkiae]
MKALTRSVFVLIIISVATSAWAYPRAVLFEDFTSTTCPPCYTSAQVVEPVLASYSTSQITPISYHMGWPGAGNDPWYLANEDENYQRRYYYGVNSIPYIYIDGTLTNSHDGNAMRTRINAQLADESEISMPINVWFDGDSLYVTISTITSQDISGATLHIALVETFVEWNTPAPNGMTEFIAPMVRMYPNGNGQTFEADTGVEDEFIASFAFDDDWDIENLTVLAFVQSTFNDDILQSSSATINTDVPVLGYNSHRFTDTDQWRPNNRPDAGETVNLIVNLSALEIFESAYNVSGTLSCEDEEITIDEATATWPDIMAGTIAGNIDAPFTITIPEGYDPKFVNFSIEIIADDFARVVTFEGLLGVPGVLLVNDHGSGENEYDTWWRIFENAGFICDFSDGEFAEALELDEYRTIIWATASSSNSSEVLTNDEIASMTNFLDNGGNLLLTSQYAGEAVGGDDWFQTYFAAEHATDAVATPGSYGAKGIQDGLFPDAIMALIGAGGAGNSVSPSSMTALEGGTPLYTYINVEDIAGVAHSTDTYSTIYLGFPLESIAASQASQSSDEVLMDLLGWLGEELDVPGGASDVELPTQITLTPYPNPFNSTLTVTYSLPTAQEIQLEVLNILGQRVTLLEQGWLTAGTHKISWQAENQTSGLYIVRLNYNADTRSAKVLLVK